MSKSNASIRSLEPGRDRRSIRILDQTLLPHAVETIRLETVAGAANAISSMQVRGSNLIGVTAAFGMAFGMREDPSDAGLEKAFESLVHTRPTAVNLRWALERMRTLLKPLPTRSRPKAAWDEAVAMVAEDVAINRAIGENGLELFRKLLARKKSGEPLRIMTHCNAGRIATLDWGTATAPIYLAHQAGIPVHVWVSETRPRNQGAALTAWALRPAVTSRSTGRPAMPRVDHSASSALRAGGS
jgi:methylthioribose-1-phosphate isomerase